MCERSALHILVDGSVQRRPPGVSCPPVVVLASSLVGLVLFRYFFGFSSFSFVICFFRSFPSLFLTFFLFSSFLPSH